MNAVSHPKTADVARAGSDEQGRQAKQAAQEKKRAAQARKQAAQPGEEEGGAEGSASSAGRGDPGGEPRGESVPTRIRTWGLLLRRGLGAKANRDPVRASRHASPIPGRI
jgi:hypothetical protein